MDCVSFERHDKSHLRFIHLFNEDKQFVGYNPSEKQFCIGKKTIKNKITSISVIPLEDICHYISHQKLHAVGSLFQNVLKHNVMVSKDFVTEFQHEKSVQNNNYLYI